MKKKLFALGVVVALATFMISAIALAAPVEQSTVLGGTVTNVVPVGTHVQEGDALLSVETIGGPMVAARATTAGVVTTVTVEQGATVEVGQNIAVIDSAANK